MTKNKTSFKEFKSSPKLLHGEQLTYRLFPIKKNQVVVRLENLDDKFDLRLDHAPAHINLEKLAIQLF